MNPLLFSLLQNQSGQPNQMMPQMPMGQTQQPQENYVNPFDAGIQNAIRSARESMALSQEQKQKALSDSLLQFSSALSAPQQQYWGDNSGSAMLRNISAAMGPSMQAYNASEVNSQKENMALSEYMVKLREAQNEATMKAMKEALDRKHQDEVLAETRRGHDLQKEHKDALLSLKFQKERNRQDDLNPSGVMVGDQEFFPIATKNERKKYTDIYRETGDILNDFKEIKQDMLDYQGMDKSPLTNPQQAYMPSAVANLFGNMVGDPKITAKRKALNARLEKANVDIERKTKGGALTDSLVKYFENKEMMPKLSDREEVAHAKIDQIIHDLETKMKAAQMSLKMGVHVNPYDLTQMKEKRHQSDGKDLSSISNDELLKIAIGGG